MIFDPLTFWLHLGQSIQEWTKKFFKDCLLQILLDPFSNTLTHMLFRGVPKKSRSENFKRFFIKVFVTKFSVFFEIFSKAIFLNTFWRLFSYWLLMVLKTRAEVYLGPCQNVENLLS